MQYFEKQDLYNVQNQNNVRYNVQNTTQAINQNNVVQENLRGIRVVKSYVREDFEIEKVYGSDTANEETGNILLT